MKYRHGFSFFSGSSVIDATPKPRVISLPYSPNKPLPMLGPRGQVVVVPVDAFFTGGVHQRTRNAYIHIQARKSKTTEPHHMSYSRSGSLSAHW